MTIRTSSQALAVAKGQTRNTPGTCQLNVHDWFLAPSVGDVDKDGDADAVDGWLSEPASARHVGDRNPPAGKPLSFKGGSHGYGHRALSAVKGVVSTDMYNNYYRAGYTSTVTGTSVSDAIAKIERAMGVEYVGWSNTISGIPIPPDPAPPKTIMTVRAATNNLMALPHNSNVLNAIQADNTIPIVGFQEADPPDYKKALKKRYPAIIGLGALDDNTRAAPLVVNADRFSHVKTGTRLIHRGAAGISFTRRLTWCLAEEKKTGIRLGVINLHAVRVKNDDLKAKRLAMRASDKAALKAQVDFFQKLGIPVIITGDFNDTSNWLGSVYGGQRVQRVQNGIDQILVVDCPKSKWTIDRFNHVNTTSDHDVLRAQFHLSLR